MKLYLSSFIVITIIFLIAALSSCKKETSCEGCRDTNKPPVAIAGSDKNITLPVDSIELDGTASTDPDGSIIEWKWSKISGPTSFVLRTPTAAQSTAASLVEGTYIFVLKVTDNSGLSDIDTIEIKVINAIQINRPPIADAGADQIIILPATSSTLNGNNSTDPDNNIVSYKWTKISGPSFFNIVTVNAVQTQVNNLSQAVYLFELKVTDAGGLFDLDTVQIEVRAPVTGTHNVLFFFRDPTGGLDAANIAVIEGFIPQTILVKVKIATFPDANIEGVWSLSHTPWCPISTIYYEATSYGLFYLPPGTYSWTAESVTTNLSGFPSVPNSFLQYWSTPHSALGTITVQQGDCVIKEIVF